MESKWVDIDAAKYIELYKAQGEDLALRTYTSRLLGLDPALVLHGGGNTSVKTTQLDDLGRSIEVLCVKGSGWDMGNIEPAGLPAVSLLPLLEFRVLEKLSDEDMVNASRRNLRSASSPTPSVETLLHAFLPHKFIDHTHADAVLAIANQPNAEEVCRKIWGDSMGIVPYIMPGFFLSKAALDVYEQNPTVQGLILINHGIFTFGDSAQQAYERMIEKVSLAEVWLERSAAVPVPANTQLENRDDKLAANCLTVLRGCLVNHADGFGSVILHQRRSSQIESFLVREDLADLATRGPITPDHIIRTKQKPLILTFDENSAAFKAQVEAQLDAYVSDYNGYFSQQCRNKQVTRTRNHPLPIVFLIRGLGLVTMAPTVKAAAIAADVYEHTIDTILKAESVGRYQPLDQSHLFDMEYWSLEQAKLGKSKPREMEGKVTFITGAAGGIGAATAHYFAARGSNLVLTDLAGEELANLSLELRTTYGVTVIHMSADITDEAQVSRLVARAATSLGGLDVVVSNAGLAITGPIHEATEQLQKSLQINLLSHQFLAAASTRLMLLQGLGGCLLFNASKSAFNPGPGFGAYSVPKAALVALMKQYAVEFATAGIRTGAVNADRIRTNLFDTDLLKARAAARGLTANDYFKANLLGLEVTARDVARAFYHLYASPKTTACVLTVDGGNIAASPR